MCMAAPPPPPDPSRFLLGHMTPAQKAEEERLRKERIAKRREQERQQVAMVITCVIMTVLVIFGLVAYAGGATFALMWFMRLVGLGLVIYSAVVIIYNFVKRYL